MGLTSPAWGYGFSLHGCNKECGSVRITLTFFALFFLHDFPLSLSACFPIIDLKLP